MDALAIISVACPIFETRICGKINGKRERIREDFELDFYACCSFYPCHLLQN
jgi:hypothetical protein